MPVRDFAAGGVIRTAIGAGDTGVLVPLTYVALLKFGPSEASQWVIARQDAGHANAAKWSSFGREPDLHLYPEGQNGATFKPPNNEWVIVVAVKTIGASKAVYYYYRFATSTWSSSESNIAFSAKHEGEPAEFQLGRYNATEQFTGRYAAALIFNKAFSKAEVESLSLVASLQDWLAMGPKTMWTFNQKEVGEGVKDLTGNGADQTSREGTTVAEEEPPIPYTPIPPRIAVNREYPSDKHMVLIRDKRGQLLARWAEDEARKQNVMNGLQLSGQVPGGRKELKVTLPRNPRYDFQDIQGFLNIEVQQPGRNRIWDGRIGKAPRSDGDRMKIDGEAVGWAAALEDRKALRFGAIDADMTKWGDPSVAYRLAQIEAARRIVASTSLGFSTLDPKATAPSIINDFSGVSASAGFDEMGVATYDSGGPDIGMVIYDYDQLTNNAASAEWESNMGLGQTDIFEAGAVLGENHQRTNVRLEQRSVTATGTGYRYARLRDRLAGGAVTGPMNDVIAWQNLRVISRLAMENLALQGMWPEVGYTAGQLLRLFVPMFSDLRATEQSVEEDPYIIQQAWWSDPGTLARFVDDVVKFGLYDWFVQDQRLFELRAPGTYGRRWQAYQGPSNFEEAGVDTDRCWDRIMVAYNDVDGSTRYVGYPGSGADVESAALQITDPEHPAVKAEITREDLLSLDGISTATRALEAGERWLQEANELSRSGRAILSGYIRDEFGVMRPVGQVAEGDLLHFPDARDKSYRKVVDYDYSGDGRSVTVSLDAPHESVKALLERFSASLTRLGFNR